MAIFPEDLRSLLVATTSLADSLGSTLGVHYNHVPQRSVLSYIWFRTASDNVPLCLKGETGIHHAMYDVEVVGATESAAQTVADHVHAKLHGFKGTVANSSAQGMFLMDKDDTYVPKGINSDDGRHVIAYDLEVWYST